MANLSEPPNNNGYAIYPICRLEMDLAEAMAVTAAESQLPENGYQARVEDCDSEKIIVRFKNGREVR